MLRLGLLSLLFAAASAGAGADGQRPAYLLDVPASAGVVLVAETSTATLHYFRVGSQGPERVGGSYMSIGSKGAGKERAWDRRTPLGIYFITEQLDTTRLDAKYGPTAFPLDYPNIWDRLNRRSGDGIWIHGVTPGQGRRPPLDTDGCIALPNEELLALEPRLQPLVTPVVITRAIDWVSREELTAVRDELREALDNWVSSFASGDLHRHLSLYGPDFTYRGMDRGDWVAFRTRSLTRAPPRSVVLDDVYLLRDPVQAGLYLARFRQAVAYDESTVETVKRLYWQRMPDGALKIVAEDNG